MNKDLSGQQNSQNQKRAVEIHQSQYFSGPLPPPEVLKKFDEVVPGAAERIIKMAEGQFEHRTELEKKVINSDIERSKWGQILGFIIAVLGLAVSLILVLQGYQVVGGIIGGATLVSLVSVFVVGTKSRTRERREKEEKQVTE